MNIIKSGYDLKTFFEKVRTSGNRILLLDYDGTLAPFTEDRNKAFPYDGIREILLSLIESEHSRVVIISGRSVEDLKPLLGLKRFPEIWGSHGWEHLSADNIYTGPEPEEKYLKAFENARKSIEKTGLMEKFEVKPVSVALHWRGLEEEKINFLKENTAVEWQRLADNTGLQLHNFDGGLELRVPGRDKGFAVNSILAGLKPDEYVAAFLGDDLTDEDAFRAINGRGLSVLVRNEIRETLAEVWLKPPDELFNFLNLWKSVSD